MKKKTLYLIKLIVWEYLLNFWRHIANFLTFEVFVETFYSFFLFNAFSLLLSIMIEMKTIHFVPKIEYMESDELITLNAMGTKFTIKASLLKTSKIDEGSRLAMLRNYTTLTSQEILKCCDGFDPVAMEFFFMRDPDVLKLVLNYLITGELHMRTNLCEVP